MYDLFFENQAENVFWALCKKILEIFGIVDIMIQNRR